MLLSCFDVYEVGQEEVFHLCGDVAKARSHVRLGSIDDEMNRVRDWQSAQEDDL